MKFGQEWSKIMNIIYSGHDRMPFESQAALEVGAVIREREEVTTDMNWELVFEYETLVPMLSESRRRTQIGH